MPVNLTTVPFGSMPDGSAVKLFVVQNRAGVKLMLSPYGATITELHAPDTAGNFANIVLGFPSLDGYLGPHPHFGCTVGRVANRIRGAQFTLGDQLYPLEANNGPNCLHGGKLGLGRRLWRATALEGADAAGVEFTYISPDGEDGFPGSVQFGAIYTLDEKGIVRLEMSAAVDTPTPINLTNHAYFNLCGAGPRDVLGHELTIAADFYTPLDDTQIPTGEIRSVIGTPLDFRTPKKIGQDIAAIEPGYDHNYVLTSEADSKGLRLAGAVRDPVGGRGLRILTTQPGVQLYTGNHLTGTLLGNGGLYPRFGGLCLETQHFPDAVHHPHFPSIIVEPARPYHHVVEYHLEH